MSTITTTSPALATVLNEIAKLSDYLNDELVKVAWETSQAREALASGDWVAFFPDTTKVNKYAAQREALLVTTKALGATDEELKLALSSTRPYFSAE